MKHCIASGTSHAGSTKIKASFLKTGQIPFPHQISVSQAHTDIGAGNSGYS